MLKVKTSQGVWSITTDHTGKMKGMWSTSTSAVTNKFCIAHRDTPNSICKKCYAAKQLKFRPSQDMPYQENMKTLSAGLLPMEEIPFLNCAYFRIESFGDIENEVQAMNYISLVLKNHHCNFAWFTKNPIVLEAALKKMKITKENKPKNLHIILSSLYENKPTDLKPWYVDKVFTVYSKDFIKDNNININCGAKSCMGCLQCYTKNKTFYVNEQEK